MLDGNYRSLPLLLSVALIMIGCRGDRRDPVDPADATAPILIVASLTPETYDPDDDGFLELNASFNDPESGIDLESVRVRSLDGVNGSATSDDNLLDHWSWQGWTAWGCPLRRTSNNFCITA